MGKPISKITIVGGGTAGWLAALLLQGNFQGNSKRKGQVEITLIESPTVPTVGVGEATVPGMPRTLRQAGVSEREFFKACNASFKLGVMFRNWNVDRNGKQIDYINPFARPNALAGVHSGYYFMQHGAGPLEFAQTFSPSLDLVRRRKGPRPLGAGEFAQNAGFAYHLDAGKFSTMIRDICVARGVRHIREDVVKVEQDERGYISALMLKESGRHKVELVLDCTGFKGVIINEVLKEPFINYSKYLANDRALAVQIPHTDPTKIDSATQSTALGAGWVWRVPLFNRIGTGYVFSSAHRTDEEAREEFLAHLGAEGKGAEPRVIPMRVGRSENAWVKNCVAVGLSGGFIEPLESTAIHMIDTAIRWLITYFPDTDFADPLRDRYNKLSGKLYDEVRDFICLHYALGNRTDSQYWLDARHELEVPDSLAENLELWKYTLPGPFDLEFESLFSVYVYHAVLLGKRVYETGYGSETMSANVKARREIWDKYLRNARAEIGKVVNNMADHYTLLCELRGEPVQQPMAAFSGIPLAQPTVAMPGQPLPRVAPQIVTPFDKDDDASLL